MKTTFALAGLLAAALALAPGPALAWSSHGPSRTSVFPRPADPWRHWGHHQLHQQGFKHHHGVKHHHGFKRHHGIKHHHGFRRHGTVIVVPRGHHVKTPVWVPGRWVWNGFAWLWAPGHWIR